MPIQIPRGVRVGVIVGVRVGVRPGLSYRVTGLSNVNGEYILVLSGVLVLLRAARRAEPGVAVAAHMYGELFCKRFLRLVGAFSF